MSPPRSSPRRTTGARSTGSRAGSSSGGGPWSSGSPRSPRATDDLRRQAATWGERERFIVERLDGKTSAETIAALWTDGNPTSMVAAQVKVFCDQLAERGLLD